LVIFTKEAILKMNLSKKQIAELKRKARQRTSKENEKLDPLNMSLKELGYTREDAYNLGYEDCEIIYTRKMLDLIGVSYA
jgi:hypothetical protein